MHSTEIATYLTHIASSYRELISHVYARAYGIIYFYSPQATEEKGKVGKRWSAVRCWRFKARFRRSIMRAPERDALRFSTLPAARGFPAEILFNCDKNNSWYFHTFLLRIEAKYFGKFTHGFSTRHCDLFKGARCERDLILTGSLLSLLIAQFKLRRTRILFEV